MNRKPTRYPVLFAVIVLMSLTAGIVSAATVTQNITYQGKLTNAAGNPLTGTYNVTFRIYATSTGATVLSTDTHVVTAVNGLFTTSINVVNPSVVQGGPLWLGIRVGSDPEMTPRQEIRPVPFALSLRPGALIVSTESSPALLLKNSGGGEALNISTTADTTNDAVVVSTAGLISNGVRVSTAGNTSHGVMVFTEGPQSTGFYTHTRGSKAEGILVSTSGIESEGVEIQTTNSSSDGVLVLTHGTGSHGISATTNNDGSYGVNVETNGDGSHGLSARTRGTDSDGVHVSTSGSSSFGVYASTTGPNSDGIYDFTTGPNSEGIIVLTGGSGSEGVMVTTTNSTSTGVSVSTYGTNSHGLQSTTYKTGSYGVNVETNSDDSPGVYAKTEGQHSDGISSYTTGDSSPGASIHTTGMYSRGIDLETHGYFGYGVFTKTYGDVADAVYASSEGRDGYGLYAESNQSYGVFAQTTRADNKYGIYTPDYIFAKGTQYPAVDIAEYMPVRGEVKPGTVLVIGKGGVLSPSSAAYDTRVAGIVSTDPGVFLGTKEGGNPGEALIAIAGRVPCRVDASYGPINEGDLLSTSNTPGHAMKAEPTIISGRGFYPDGTILGKAMGSLESGTGTIDVLVTLQ